MSSMATHHVWPANDTVSARLAARSPSSQPPTSSAVRPLGDLVLGQRAEQPQQIGDAFGVARRAILAAGAAAGAWSRDDVRVEQLAQFDAAEQLGEQHAVQRQRGGAALGQRAVALVHERADVSEQQRGGERRRRGRSRPRPAAAGAGRAGPSARSASARRRRPAGIRGPPRARSGSPGTCARRRAAVRRAGAGATAATACRDGGGAAAARGPRIRGTARRTAPSRPPRR